MIAAALALTIFAQADFTPEEAKSIFAQANEAYYSEDFTAAKEGYEKLLAHGYGGADVLYNLGTTCLAAGQLGEAVLYLERARRLGNDEDVEANLVVARSRRLDQVVGAQAEEPFIQRLVLATSSTLVGWGFLASWVLTFGLLILLRGSTQRLALWLGAGCALIAAICLGLILGAHAYVGATLNEGVVIAKELKALELPKEGAKASFEVHAGLKVRVLGAEGRYVRIRLPNGLEGWAQKEGVEEI